MKRILCFVLFVSPAAAARIDYEFTGVVESVQPHSGGRVDFWGIEVIGLPVDGTISIDDTQPPKTIYDNQATYLNALDIEFSIGDRIHMLGTGRRLYVTNDNGFNRVDSFSSSQGGLLAFVDGVRVDAVDPAIGRSDRNGEMFDSVILSEIATEFSLGTGGGIHFESTLFMRDDQSNEAAPYSSLFIDWQTLTRVGVPGDANFDGLFDAADLNILALNWQKPGDWQQGDFSRDGFVDATDLNSLALNWQRQPAMASLVPEPSTGALAIFALAAVTCLRRRILGT